MTLEEYKSLVKEYYDLSELYATDSTPEDLVKAVALNLFMVNCSRDTLLYFETKKQIRAIKYHNTVRFD